MTLKTATQLVSSSSSGEVRPSRGASLLPTPRKTYSLARSALKAHP